MKKRLIALFLVLAMVFQPVLPAAAEAVTEDVSTTTAETEEIEETAEQTEEGTEEVPESTEASKETAEVPEEPEEEETTEATEAPLEETTEAVEETTEPVEETTESTGPMYAFSGKGTEGEPYLLSEAEELEQLAELVNSGAEGYAEAYYALNADLLLGSHTSIGTEGNPFRGHFDGNGFRITGLSGGSGKYQGLFGVTEEASLVRIALEEVEFYGESGVVFGSVVGLMRGGSLERSYVAGVLDAQKQDCTLGGLVGKLAGGNLSDVFAQVTITGYDCAGGLAARAENASIANAYVVGGVTCTDGGNFDALVGLAGEGNAFSSCYQVGIAGDYGTPLTLTDAVENGSIALVDGEIWEEGTESYPFPVLSDCPYGGIGYTLPDMEEHGTGYIADDNQEPAPASYNYQRSYGVFPEKYEPSDLPDVRNQGQYGVCWAFGMVGAAEISLIRQGLADSSINLSESQLAYFHHKGTRNEKGVYNDPLENFCGDHNECVKPYYSDYYKKDYYVFSGDAYSYASYTLSSQIGLMEEDEQTAYGETNNEEIEANGLPYAYAFSKDAAVLRNVRLLPLNGNKDAIKQAVLDYGAVGVGFAADTSYMDASKHYYYASGNESSHTVLIVGWDDTISRNNFCDYSTGEKPQTDGAWIARNSWGESWGINGYIYMSYDTAYMSGNQIGYAWEYDLADENTRVYQYDGTEATGGITYDTPEISYANVFTSDGSHSLKAVSFWLPYIADVDYTVSVYTGIQKDAPESGIRRAVATGKTNLAGYYTVELDRMVYIPKGTMFSLVLTLRGKDSYTIGLDYSSDFGWTKAVAGTQPGQSYMNAYGTWQDYSAGQGIAVKCNVRIKGIAVESDDPYSGSCGPNAYYHLTEDGTLEITGSGAMQNYTAGNPAPWTKYKSWISQVTVETGITEIGSYAFQGLSGVKTIELPASVLRIGQRAFQQSGLESMKLPNSVAAVESGAFEGCTYLRTLSLPTALTQIPEAMAKDCENLQSVSLPKSIESIGESAFQGCETFTEILLPDGLTEIGGAAFEGCGSVRQVLIPRNVQMLGQRAFANCGALTQIDFQHRPEDELTIGAKAFALSGTTVTTVFVSDKSHIHESISGYDWSGSGRTVEYGQGKKYQDLALSLDGFLVLGGRRQLKVDGAGTALTIRSSNTSVVTVNSDGMLRGIKPGMATITVTAAQSDLYYGASAQLEVTVYRGDLGNGKIQLAQGALSYTGQPLEPEATITLKEQKLTLGKDYRLVYENNVSAGTASVTAEGIGEYCGSLQAEFTIQKAETFVTVEKAKIRVALNQGSFAIPVTSSDDARLVISVEPEGIIRKEDSGEYTPLQQGTAVVSFQLEETDNSFPARADVEVRVLELVAGGDYGTFHWDLDSTGNLLISGGDVTGIVQNYAPWNAYIDQIRSIEIDTGVTSICDSAFMSLTQVKEITLADTLTKIGAAAFNGCLQLQHIWIPESVEEIGSLAFTYCLSLEDITVAPENRVYSSRDGVLYNKAQDTLLCFPGGKTGAFQVPDGVRAIGDFAFRDTANIEKVTLPQGLKEIGFSAFLQSGLKHIALPNSLTKMGKQAFEGCENLADIEIPGSVKTISDFAFATCGLEHVTLGEGIEKLDSCAFLGCWQLKEITLPSSVVSIENKALGYTFLGDPVENFLIRGIPDSAVQRYAEENGIAFESTAVLLTDVPERMMAGKTIQLAAKVIPASMGTVSWSLKNSADAAYVLLSGSRLTAKAVPEELNVVLVCRAGALTEEITVTVIPAITGIAVCREGEPVGGTLTVDLNEAKTVTLTAKAVPVGAFMDPEWTWSDTKGVFGTYSQTDGILTVTLSDNAKLGTVTLTVRDRETKKSGSVKLTTMRKSTGEIAIHGDDSLAGGGSLQMKAQLAGSPSNTKVFWSLEPGDQAYAAISTSGKLTAAQVTERHTVTVHAAAADGGSEGTCQVTLLPKTSGLELTLNGETVSKAATVYLNDTRIASLAANTWPEDASDDVAWTVSSNKIVNAQVVDGKLHLVSLAGETGTVTVKATAQDGSKKTASVQVKFARRPDYVGILNSAGQPIDGAVTLRGKQSYNFKTEMWSFDDGKLTDKNLVWKFAQEYAAYATVKNGKVIVKSFASPTPIETYVRVELKSNPDIGDSVKLILQPDQTAGINVSCSGVALNGSTFHADLSEKVIHLDTETTGLSNGKIVWGPTNPKGVATVAEDGTVMLNRAGTVTITAIDSVSKKKASFKLVVTDQVKKLTIQNAPEVLSGGGKVTLKAAMTPNKPSSGKLTWYLVDNGGGAASITAAGVLTAAKVTGTHRVTVAVRTQDGTVVSEPVEIRIVPAAAQVVVSGGPDNGTVDLNTYSGLSLTATVYPNAALQDVKWTSSNKAVVVDEEGRVTILNGAKTGTVTLTAAATDGSGKKAAVKLKLVRLVTGISMVSSVTVTGGKTLKLAAAPDKSASNKKLVWSMTGDTAYCTLSGGTLKTKAVTTTKLVVVRATAADGSGVYAECQVVLLPSN